MTTQHNPYDRRQNRGFEGPTSDDLDLDQRDQQRRKTYRMPLRLWTEGRCEETLDFHNCNNLSEVGIFIENATPYPVQALVKIEFNLPGISDPVRVTGRAISCLDHQDAFENIMGNGFIFEQISPTDQARIRSYISANLSANEV